MAGFRPDINEFRGEDFRVEIETGQQRILTGKRFAATAAGLHVNIQVCGAHPFFIRHNGAVFDDLYTA